MNRKLRNFIEMQYQFKAGYLVLFRTGLFLDNSVFMVSVEVDRLFRVICFSSVGSEYISK